MRNAGGGQPCHSSLVILHLRVRGFKFGGTRPGARGRGVEQEERRIRRWEWEWAHTLAGENAESFAVYCAALFENLIERTR